MKKSIIVDSNEPNPHPGIGNVGELVLKDMQARIKMGKNKYNTELQMFNGRNALMDAYQEALDLCMYLRQAIAEQEYKSNIGD